jgi:putative mycofactocin binding protein MftB
MTYRLGDNVQVRKESWGLLFYQRPFHKVYFIRSGDWLYPEHFDGTWTPEKIIEDISRRTGKAVEAIEQSLAKLTERLTVNRVILHEVC